MDGLEVNAAKMRLDNELLKAASDAVIEFGHELFNEFNSRHWFTIEGGTLTGPTLSGSDMYTGYRTHRVIPSIILPADQFMIGSKNA